MGKDWMVNSEHILFDIDLQCTGNPTVDIYIDDVLQSGTKFYTTLDFGPHILKIVHSGKTNHTPENSVKIERIKVDGVDIRDIIWTRSINTPVYPEPWATQQREQGIELEETVIGQSELSHNCSWQLEFTSPFYKFVMDDIF